MLELAMMLGWLAGDVDIARQLVDQQIFKFQAAPASLSRLWSPAHLHIFPSQRSDHRRQTQQRRYASLLAQAALPCKMRLGLSGLSLRKPSRQQMEDFAEAGMREGPNHLLVGASEDYEPQASVTSSSRVVDGWIEDFDAVRVGEGKEAFLTAREAVRSWKHMQLGWVETNRPPVKPGSAVCIAARLLCLWQRSPLEIVHVTDEAAGFGAGGWTRGRHGRGRERRFSFGQTTLSGHQLAGEESFTVRWKADNSVWYEVYAFSRADSALAVAAYPLRRFFQRRFRRDSARVMQATVAAG